MLPSTAQMEKMFRALIKSLLETALGKQKTWPATKAQLLTTVVDQEGGMDRSDVKLSAMMAKLPDRKYTDINDVAAELAKIPQPDAKDEALVNSLTKAFNL